MWMKESVPEKALPFEAGFELDAAIHLLAGNALDLQILQRLVGRPHRFSELRASLPVKNDTDLTRALRRLLDMNLVDQRGDFRKDPVVRTYQLNPFGVSVLFTIARIQNVNQNIELAQSVLDAKQRLAANA